MLQPSERWLRSVARVLSPGTSILSWRDRYLTAAASPAVSGQWFVATFRWNGRRDSLMRIRVRARV
jgi:hypothetical protein